MVLFRLFNGLINDFVGSSLDNSYNFPEFELDISPFTNGIVGNYDLFAASCCRRENMEYIAFCRDWALIDQGSSGSLSDKWYIYCHKEKPKRVLADSEMLSHVPHVLFYVRKNAQVPCPASELRSIGGYSSSESSSRGRRLGLANMGSTCYLNSLIQYTMSIDILSDYLHINRDSILKKEGVLKEYYRLLIKDSTLNINDNAIVPSEFLQSWMDNFPMYAGLSREHDPTEAMLHFFSCFNIDGVSPTTAVFSDDDATIVKPGIIANIFGYVARRWTTCPSNHVKTSLEYQSSLPLEVIDNANNIIELLASYFNNGSTVYKCDSGCQGIEVTGNIVIKFLEMPTFLIVTLNRSGNGTNGKKLTPVAFPVDNLDLSEFCAESIDGGMVYDLHCAIFHCGNTLHSGHYYTVCRESQTWYKYNDRTVEIMDPVDFSPIEVYALIYRQKDCGGEYAESAPVVADSLSDPNAIDSQLLNDLTNLIANIPSKIAIQKQNLKYLVEKIQQHNVKTIVFMCGAGISVGAGIPTFRSPDNNLYDKILIDFPELVSMGVDPKTIFFYDFVQQHLLLFYTILRKYFRGNPTSTHDFMRSVALNRNVLVLTQNIDCLELKGQENNDNYRVVQVHGSIEEGRCTDCSKPFENFGNAFYNTTGVPSCLACQGNVRPSIVLMDEAVNNLSNEFGTVEKADVVFIMGTSLQIKTLDKVIMKIPKSAVIVVVDIDEKNNNLWIKNKRVVFLKGDVVEVVRLLKRLFEEGDK